MQQGNINRTFRTYSPDSVTVYTVSSNKKLGNCNNYFKFAFHISKFEINHGLYNNAEFDAVSTSESTFLVLPDKD